MTLPVTIGVFLAICLTCWRFRTRLSDRTLLWLWTAGIAVLTVPWNDMHLHSHWPAVRWVPFVSPPIRAFDILANIALYVPLGFYASGAWRSSGPGVALGRVVALGLVISVAAELTQVFSHTRIPSTTDIVTNVTGAAVGVRITRRPIEGHVVRAG